MKTTKQKLEGTVERHRMDIQRIHEKIEWLRKQNKNDSLIGKAKSILRKKKRNLKKAEQNLASFSQK